MSGSMAILGEDAAKTYNVFQEYLPKFGFKNKYKFLFEDGQCGVGNAAVTAAQKLINIEKVRFLLIACSGEVLQVGPIAQREGVLTVAFMASNPGIKNLGDYIFRTFLDIEDGALSIAKLMNKEGRSRIALVTEESSFTSAISSKLKEIFGEKIIFFSDFLVTDDDHRSLLQKLKVSNADAIYLNVSTPRTYINMVRLLSDLKITLPIYTYYQSSHRDSIAALGTLQDGAEFFDVPNVSSSAEAFREFYGRFMEVYPQGPSSDFAVRAAFDALRVVLLGIELKGYNSQAVRDYLATTKFDGALGAIEFDSTGDIKNIPWQLKKIIDGKVVLLNE